MVILSREPTVAVILSREATVVILSREATKGSLSIQGFYGRGARAILSALRASGWLAGPFAFTPRPRASA